MVIIMGNTKRPLSHIDVDKLPIRQSYRVVPAGADNPFKQGFHERKFFMTPANRFIAVQDHEPAAAEILGNKYDSNAQGLDDNSAELARMGWVRIIALGREIVFSWKPSISQLRELKNLAIETHMSLIDDTHDQWDVIYEPEIEESCKSVDFNDALPVDYTADDVDDGGLINRQTYKRHRPLREAGLPYRKANSHRTVERALRRESRPYLNLDK